METLTNEKTTEAEVKETPATKTEFLKSDYETKMLRKQNKFMRSQI